MPNFTFIAMLGSRTRSELREPTVPQFSYAFIAKTDRDVQNYTGFKHIEALTAFKEACVEKGVDVEYTNMPTRPAADVKPRGMVFFFSIDYSGLQADGFFTIYNYFIPRPFHTFLWVRW